MIPLHIIPPPLSPTHLFLYLVAEAVKHLQFPVRESGPTMKCFRLPMILSFMFLSSPLGIYSSNSQGLRDLLSTQPRFRRAPPGQVWCPASRGIRRKVPGRLLPLICYNSARKARRRIDQHRVGQVQRRLHPAARYGEHEAAFLNFLIEQSPRLSAEEDRDLVAGCHCAQLRRCLVSGHDETPPSSSPPRGSRTTMGLSFIASATLRIHSAEIE